MLQARGVRWVCMTAGSPYYCPHVAAAGALPADRRLRAARGSAARRRAADRRHRAAQGGVPEMAFVGSAYTYLQEWLPNVAQYNVRHGLTPTSSASAA